MCAGDREEKRKRREDDRQADRECVCLSLGLNERKTDWRRQIEKEIDGAGGGGYLTEGMNK